MEPMQLQKPSAKLWFLTFVIACIGVAWQYGSLSLIERLVTSYPSVPDVLMDKFPQMNFGIFGELLFFSLVLLFVIPHFRWRWQDTPRVIIALGIFYFVRGWFMFLFPIGPPAGALAPDERLNLWGYANHAYFPGGHIGILTILAMHTKNIRIRRLLWVGLIVFGIGTMLAKNHYTMDSVAGIIIGYAISVWLARRWMVDSPTTN